MATVVSMTAGERVWVKNSMTNGSLDGHQWSQFSGHLIALQQFFYLFSYQPYCDKILRPSSDGRVKQINHVIHICTKQTFKDGHSAN